VLAFVKVTPAPGDVTIMRDWEMPSNTLAFDAKYVFIAITVLTALVV
jgi:hypothetical protein